MRGFIRKTTYFVPRIALPLPPHFSERKIQSHFRMIPPKPTDQLTRPGTHSFTSAACPKWEGRTKQARQMRAFFLANALFFLAKAKPLWLGERHLWSSLILKCLMQFVCFLSFLYSSSLNRSKLRVKADGWNVPPFDQTSMTAMFCEFKLDR